MKNKKLTVRVVEDRLNKDEGAWLKSLGEIGDLARLIFNLRSDIASMNQRLLKLEGRLKND